jgi:hypothetical protein
VTTAPPAPPSKQVGCLGGLAIPLLTIALAAKLLFAPASAALASGGPYRTPPPDETTPRPLTPAATRFVGAMLLSCTLLPSLLLATRAIYVYRDSPAGLALMAPVAWVVMFIGHLVSMKLLAWLLPRLPRHDA